MLPESAPHARKSPTHDHGDVAENLPLQPGRCDWCGSKLKPAPNGRPKRFCCEPCRLEWWKLAQMRGKQVVHGLSLWRKHRGGKGTPGEGVLSTVASQVDKWLAEDRERISEMQREQGS